MAEQEIAKHGKQVIRLLGSKQHSLGHKAREVAIEFVTILFAVLLSICLHGWSEHRLRDYRDDTLAEDSPAATFTMLSTPKARLLLKQMTTTDQHYARYRQYAQLSRDIIKRIDDYPGMGGGAAH